METIIQQLKEKSEQLKGLRLGQSLDFKAATTMLESTNITGAGLDELNPQQLYYIPIKRSINNTIFDLLPKINVSSHSIVVTNETSDEGTINAATTEGAAKNQIGKDDSVTTPTMAKYTAFVKISREMLDDIGFMNDQITRLLARRLNKAISALLLPQILTVTPTLTSAGLTAGTGGTTIFDCIKAVTADMEIQNGYTPNLWLFNQPDYAKAYIQANANSTWFDTKQSNILPTSLVTAAYIVGLDADMFPMYIYKDLGIQVGYENDDFTKNLVTIRGEVRLTFPIVGNSLNALYHDTIAATVARIA